MDKNNMWKERDHSATKLGEILSWDKDLNAYLWACLTRHKQTRSGPIDGWLIEINHKGDMGSLCLGTISDQPDMTQVFERAEAVIKEWFTIGAESKKPPLSAFDFCSYQKYKYMAYIPRPGIPGCDMVSKFSPEKFWEIAGTKYTLELLASAPKNILCKWEKEKDNYYIRKAAFGDDVVVEISKTAYGRKYFWIVIKSADNKPCYLVTGLGTTTTLKKAKTACDAILKKLGWILVD